MAKLIKEKQDNHCLFRAFSRNVQNKPPTINDALSMRKNIAEYISNNADKYKPFLDEDEGEFYKYCWKIQSTNKWGGEHEIMAFSDKYKTQVLVYSKTKKLISKHGEKYKKKLCLSYENKNH